MSSFYPECSLCGESQQSVLMCNVSGKHHVNIRALEPTRIIATGTGEERQSVCVCLCTLVLTSVKSLVYPLLPAYVNNAY